MFINTYLQQLKGIKSTKVFDAIWCTIRYGASPNNYKSFDFYTLNAAQRDSYVTNRLSRKMCKTFNSSDYVYLFEDKTVFAEHFAEYFRRDWISNNGLSRERFMAFIDEKDRFIYKPIGNAQGQGIKVYDDLRDPYKIYSELMSQGEQAILESWIQQHEALARIYPDAINCLRIITACTGNDVMFLSGGVTWGNGKKIANASASGIVSPVNFATGVLEKPAADFAGHVYDRHPITGEKLVGFELPFWKETIMMLQNAAKKVPEVGYVGWDVAIAQDGPIIIEGNTTPGYRYYQIPVHMKDKIGNKAIYLEALKKRK